MRTQSEAVVAATLKTHRIEHWIAAPDPRSGHWAPGGVGDVGAARVGRSMTTTTTTATLPMLGCEHRLGTVCTHPTEGATE